MVVEMGFCEGGPLVELGPLTKNALYLSVIIFKNIKRQTDPYCKVDKEVNKRKKNVFKQIYPAPLNGLSLWTC